MKSQFATIRKNKVHEEVANQIEKLILEKLRPGDKLPSERELTELLGVSRSSIRDGIRRLELVGLVEPPLAARAARHATAKEIAGMEGILRRQREKMRSGVPAVEEDSEFHYAIATASRNSVVLKVLDVIMDMLRETRGRSLQTEGRAEKSFDGHRKMLAAIKRHDAAGAERAMRQHVKDVEGMVLKKF